jgi:hypothetical protein
LRPDSYFGRYHDDSVYFSSAKALAQGRGYIIPSLPGSPPQTKYPVLYPWLLSWVWRWKPSFPSNIVPAVWITAFFGCWFLAAAFQLLRKLDEVGDWPATAMVALCAFQPLFLVFSGCLMSDLPFMALMLTAALVADGAMRTTRRLDSAAIAGALAGLSTMMRSLGLAVVAGLFATALYRRAYRQAGTVCVGAAPFVFASLWASRPCLASAWGMAHGASALPGWQQTLLYYTSYVKFWRLCVPRSSVLLQMLSVNLKMMVEAPPFYFLAPTLGIRNSLASNGIGAIVSAGVAAGVVRQARGQEWKPIHFILVFYSAVVLLWNWPIPDRFLLPFLPLFCAGLWVEGKRLVRILLAGLRAGRPANERVLAGAMLIGVAMLAGIAAWNYCYGYRPQLRRMGEQRALIMREKTQAYQWIRQNTDPDTRFVAYEDPSFYLYTGRQAVLPMVFSTEYVYVRETSLLERDLAHITDAARAVRARYWFTSEDDFRLELEDAQPVIEERVARLMSTLPEVYHSANGRVRLYDISPLLRSQPKARHAGVSSN